MKIKLKGKIISTKGDENRLKRIINVCKKIQQTKIQTNEGRQWTDFVLIMLENKLNRKVGSVSFETAQVNS
jgi:hypothetical protein|tara:strand:+ start:4938 stop:5150 length:213 start_codon:yes stop_codon:yes gene_type:complete